MKVLVTGVNGQLGFDVCRLLTVRGIENRGVDISDFDITDAAAVREYILSYAPDAVVHCAAYTAVDRAEDEEEKCRKINTGGTRNIAAACAETGAAMLYISTDYVYGGGGETPHTVTDKTGPESVYGRTKLDGEASVISLLKKYFIIRTSWVFGINGGNFVKTMLRLGKEKDRLSVVCDQIGSPTYTVDLARLICDMIVTDKYGIYHGTNEGYCSWADFAERIMLLGKTGTVIDRIPTSMYPSRAKRPLNSRLDKTCLDRAGFERLPSWENALERFFSELKGVNG